MSRVLDDPVVALLPWFAFSFLLGPLSFTEASFLAFVVSALLVGAAWLRGMGLRSFEFSDLVLFGGIALIAHLHDPASQSWLSDHADAVSNVVLTVIAFGSVLIGKPFTSQYSSVRFEGLDAELRARLDRNSAVIWGVALLLASLVAVYGEWILDQQSNLWTAWILQTVPLIVALELTVWIGRRAIAGSAAGRTSGEADPSPILIWRDLFAWLIPVGACSLIFDGGPPGLGWFLVALGCAGTVATSVLLSRRVPAL